MPPKSAPLASPSVPPKSAPPASPSVTDTSSGEEEDEEQLSPPSIRPSATATAAPKPAAARDPPTAAASASSSGEEDSSSGEEGDEEESGSGEEETVEMNQPPPPPTKIPAAESETESDSSDDSDSDANPPTAPRHSARVADPAVKPLASKPMTSAPKPPKPEPAATSSIPPSGAGQKAFQRIWSDEDEIAILLGLINYNANHGRIPFTAAGMDPYYDSIHDSLQMDANKSQLHDKLHRLKKKYGNSRTRSKGMTPSFSKQHDSVVYELSHKLWGEPMTESEKRQRVNHEKVEWIAEDDDGDVAMLKGRYPYLMEALSGMGDSVQGSIMVKEALKKIDETKAMALEAKLKKQKLEEARYHMRFMDLKKDSLKLVLDAVEKQG